MVEHIDPGAIEDEGLRQAFVSLMNVVENLSDRVADLTSENQRLRDEINRLKGEQGRPKIKAGKPRADLSSQKERRESREHHKSSKQDQIKIDREMLLQVDRSQLPEDAVFKGYQQVVVQDITFCTNNILFRKEKYYSPSQKRTYLAPFPAGYHGQFGPGVRAWVLVLYFSGRMSEPKILEVLHTIGMQISAGELSDLLIKDQKCFHDERAHILEAGIKSSPWQHLDSTGTTVNGQHQHCHILCNPLYTLYCTQGPHEHASRPSWGS